MLLERSHDTRNMKKTPKRATVTTAAAERRPPRWAGASVPRNTEAMRICVGHLPLQREKLLVMMAMRRSLGLSMIRVATTPAALQPKPMHMVKACFPWAPAVRKSESRLKATRGR
jgi:hypothetical protein